MKQDVPKSFNVMLYPDLEDNGGFYPPMDIAELMAKADELQEAEELGEFEAGVLFAVEHLMTVPTVNFTKECGYLLEDILAPHSNRPVDEPDDEEETQTNFCDILPPIPIEKSLTVIKEKEEPMAVYNNPNSVNINGVFIRDKKSPSGAELDAWYKARPNFNVDNWDKLMYYVKKEHYVKEHPEFFEKKETKKSVFVTPERDYTDEEMLEMLHSKEDDIIEGLAEEPKTIVIG